VPCVTGALCDRLSENGLLQSVGVTDGACRCDRRTADCASRLGFNTPRRSRYERTAASRPCRQHPDRTLGCDEFHPAAGLQPAVLRLPAVRARFTGDQRQAGDAGPGPQHAGDRTGRRAGRAILGRRDQSSLGQSTRRPPLVGGAAARPAAGAGGRQDRQTHRARAAARGPHELQRLRLDPRSRRRARRTARFRQADRRLRRELRPGPISARGAGQRGLHRPDGRHGSRRPQPLSAVFPRGPAGQTRHRRASVQSRRIQIRGRTLCAG
jgi:hypothetical protein